MKKIFLLTIALIITGTSVFAEVNRPGAPSFGTAENVTTSSPSSAYKKQGYQQTRTPKTPTLPHETTSLSPVESTAKALANAMNNDQDYQQLYRKLAAMGATDIDISTHVNGCPYRKGIPPVTLGGKTYTGKKCSFVKYTYNGKSTGVGACSN